MAYTGIEPQCIIPFSGCFQKLQKSISYLEMGVHVSISYWSTLSFWLSFIASKFKNIK
ncbi:hypothetical protein YC2023_034667 [Brassica napus]